MPRQLPNGLDGSSTLAYQAGMHSQTHHPEEGA